MANIKNMKKSGNFKIIKLSWMSYLAEQIRLISYRNGFYQGGFKGSKKQGAGLLITDSGLIIMGTWKNDELFGPAFTFLNPRQFAFLQFNRGELEGTCYFRSNSEMLLVQLNSSKPIEKQLIINYQFQKVKIGVYKNGSYEAVQTYDFDVSLPQQKVIQKYLQIEYKVPSLFDFLESNFLSNFDHINKNSINNGSLIYKVSDGSSIYNLGFTINSQNRLESYGVFMNDKLHGLGCKLEGSAKLEGVFEHDGISGWGCKFTNGNTFYGKFQNSLLADSQVIEEKKECEEKLRQLKKQYHIKSLCYFNGYVQKNVVKFSGTSQIKFQAKLQKQYLSKTVRKQLPSNGINQTFSLARSKQKKSFEQPANHNSLKNPEEETKFNKSLVLSTLKKFNL